jgi:ribosomal protein L11 methylase PrmA
MQLEADDEGAAVAMNQLKGSSHDFQDVSSLPSAYFDITVANILAPTIIRLCPTLAQHTRKSGQVAFSGGAPMP